MHNSCFPLALLLKTIIGCSLLNFSLVLLLMLLMKAVDATVDAFIYNFPCIWWHCIYITENEIESCFDLQILQSGVCIYHLCSITTKH